MPSTQSLEKSPTPEWIIDFFHEIDSKQFGPNFNIFAENAEMTFGVGHWVGLAEIKANLQRFDEVMDTEHSITAFYDGGSIKIIRGHVKMTAHDNGKVVSPAMVHLFYMDETGTNKVRATFGSVGPTSF